MEERLFFSASKTSIDTGQALVNATFAVSVRFKKANKKEVVKQMNVKIMKTFTLEDCMLIKNIYYIMFEHYTCAWANIHKYLRQSIRKSKVLQ